MVTITLHCPRCQSDALVSNGRAPNGKQKYLCRTCYRQSREDPTPHAYPEERHEEILCTYQEREPPAGARAHLWRFAYDDPGLDQKKSLACLH